MTTVAAGGVSPTGIPPPRVAPGAGRAFPLRAHRFLVSTALGAADASDPARWPGHRAKHEQAARERTPRRGRPQRLARAEHRTQALALAGG
jgi:hypothetical protein